MYTYIHTYIHTHTHTLTYTQICTQGLSKPWSWPPSIQLAECEVMRIFAVLWQIIIFAPTIHDVRDVLNKFDTMRASLVRTIPAMADRNSRVPGASGSDFDREKVIVTAREQDAGMFDGMLMSMIERIGEHNAKGGVYVWRLVCMCVCMYVCMYVCVFT